MNEAKTLILDSDAQSVSQAFKIVIKKLYSKPLVASVREILSNAIDANIEAGNQDKPVYLFDDNSGQRDYIFIQDNGPGLTPEKMDNLYSKVFRSSKRNRGDQIGNMGIGRLSILAHTRRFSLITVAEGQKYSYEVFLNELDVPSYRLLEQEETTDPNGTMVGFFCPWGLNNQEVKDLIIKNGRFASVPIKSSNEKLEEELNRERERFILKGDSWAVSTEDSMEVLGGLSVVVNENSMEVLGGLSVVVNGVSYEVPQEVTRDLVTNHTEFYHPQSFYPCVPINPHSRKREEVVFFLSDEEVDLTSSREELQMSTKTIEGITSAYSKFGFEFLAAVDRDFSEVEDFLDFIKDFNRFKSFFNAFGCVKYKGIPIHSRELKSIVYSKDDVGQFIPIEYFIDPNAGKTLYKEVKVKGLYAFNKSINSSVLNTFCLLNTDSKKKSFTSSGLNITSSHLRFSLNNLIKIKFIAYFGYSGQNCEKLISKHLDEEPSDQDYLFFRYEDEDNIGTLLEKLPLMKFLSELGIISFIDLGDVRTTKSKGASQCSQTKPITPKPINPTTKKFRSGVRRIFHPSTIPLRYLNCNNAYKLCFEKFVEKIPQNGFYIVKDAVNSPYESWWNNFSYNANNKASRIERIIETLELPLIKSNFPVDDIYLVESECLEYLLANGDWYPLSEKFKQGLEKWRDQLKEEATFRTEKVFDDSLSLKEVQQVFAFANTYAEQRCHGWPCGRRPSINQLVVFIASLLWEVIPPEKISNHKKLGFFLKVAGEHTDFYVHGISNQYDLRDAFKVCRLLEDISSSKFLDKVKLSFEISQEETLNLAKDQLKEFFESSLVEKITPLMSTALNLEHSYPKLIGLEETKALIKALIYQEG